MKTVSEEKIESRHRTFTWIVSLILGGMAILFVVTLIGRNRGQVDLQAEIAAARKLGIPLTYDEYFEREFGKAASKEPPEHVKILSPFFEDEDLLKKFVDTRFDLRTELSSYGNRAANRSAIVKNLRRLIAPYKDFMSAAKRAASLPKWPFFRSESRDYSETYQWSAGLANVSSLLMASSVVHVEDGAWEQAVGDLRSAFQLCIRLSDDRTYLGIARARGDIPRLLQLQRIFVANKACPPEFLNQMFELNELDFEFALPSQLFDLNTIDFFDLYLKPESLADYYEEESNPYIRMIDSFGKPAVTVDEARAIWLKAVRKIYVEVDMPTASYADLAAAIRRQAPRVDAAIEGLFPSSMGGYGAMSSIAELLLDAEAVEKGILAERSLMKAFLVAMKEYRRTGAFPKSLPLKGKEAIDPFSRKPYRYRLTKDGFIAYSLGKEGRDDGGKTRSTAHPTADDIPVAFPPGPMDLRRY